MPNVNGEEMEVSDEDDIYMREEEDVDSDAHEEMEVESSKKLVLKGIETVGMRVPLNPKDTIRAIDHFLFLLAHTIRHNNTYESLLDSLKWIKASVMYINLPTTKRALWRQLGRNKENLIIRLFCSKCSDEIGLGSIVRKQCACGSCGPGQGQSFVATFIQIRLRPQLMDLFRIPNIVESLRYKVNRVKINRNAVEDIYDGEQYKNLSEPGNFLSNSDNYSFTLWTHGLKTTKSFVTYPIVLQLNELPPHSRKEHLLLAGLWVGDEQPLINSILLPIAEELRDLHQNGIAWKPDGKEERISRFILSTFAADSVIRSDVLRMSNINEPHGCTFCLAPGEMINNTRVYRSQEFDMRTKASVEEDGTLAFQSKETINGVVGVSSLLTLPEFDIVNGVAVDNSDNVYLGVAKELIERYLTDKEEDWYIGQKKQIAAIDKRLLNVKTPTNIDSQPRSISLYKRWTASEWREWLLWYALPCLDGILPTKYFNHLQKLCQAMYILNSFSITKENFKTAEDLIHKFVQDYETLYGVKNMVFYVHLLIHCVQSVRNWGPLWVYSIPSFELITKQIFNRPVSLHNRAEMIVTRYFMNRFISIAPKIVPVADETKAEIYRLLKVEIEHVESTPKRPNFLGIGKAAARIPDIEEVNAVTEAGIIINKDRHILVYKKATINGAEYGVQDVKKKIYNIVFCEESRFYVVEKIFSYNYKGEIVAGIIGKCLKNNGNVYQTSYMYSVTELKKKHFIPFSKVISPGYLVRGTKNIAISSLCNA